MVPRLLMEQSEMFRATVLALSLIALPTVAVTQVAAPHPMSVEDFLLDGSSLKGKNVSVRGVALCMSGTEGCFLYASLTNLMQNASFNANSLSRDDRKRLINCSALLHYCEVVITGRAGSDPVLYPIIATRIDW